LAAPQPHTSAARRKKGMAVRMKSIRDAKAVYDAIELPPELGETIRVAARSAGRKPRHAQAFARYAACAAAVCLVLLVTALNTLPAVASGLSEIPVIGRLAQVLTFAQYERQGENELLIVRQPELANTGNTELERRINHEIQARISALIQTFQNEAKEARKLYLETGGIEEEYITPEINIDYRLHCNNGSVVSFVLIKSETHASYYEEQFYYNIDLETGKELTLLDLLGPDFKAIVNQSVKDQMKQRMQADPDAYYFEDDLAFTTISDDQGFYVNEAGHVVVVFPKYEVAPGYMGIQEFEITQ
jgi:phosphoribosylcarboxyaminoimidazole (NCAIR) mutase